MVLYLYYIILYICILHQIPGAGVAGGAAVPAHGAVRRRLRRDPAAALRRLPLEHRRQVSLSPSLSLCNIISSHCLFSLSPSSLSLFLSSL